MLTQALTSALSAVLPTVLQPVTSAILYACQLLRENNQLQRELVQAVTGQPSITEITPEGSPAWFQRQIRDLPPPPSVPTTSPRSSEAAGDRVSPTPRRRDSQDVTFVGRSSQVRQQAAADHQDWQARQTNRPIGR
jgi:hypothetical protein